MHNFCRRSTYEPKEETMRTFLALDLSAQAKEELTRLSNLIHQNCHGSFCLPETYHLTLAFLGDITQSEAQSLNLVLEDAVSNINSFDLNLCRLGYFAQPESATVFCSTAKEPRLDELAQITYKAAWDCGIDFDAKKFRAHITLGRRIDLRSFRLDSISVNPISFKVDAITLYKSTLHRTGPTYEALQRISLKALL